MSLFPWRDLHMSGVTLPHIRVREKGPATADLVITMPCTGSRRNWRKGPKSRSAHGMEPKLTRSESGRREEPDQVGGRDGAEAGPGRT